MSVRRPETTEKRSGGAPMVVAILLLLAAGAGVAWLHVSGRLAPLLAGPPAIEVELPAAMVPAAAPERETAGEPQAVAELGSAENGTGTPHTETELPAQAEPPVAVPAPEASPAEAERADTAPSAVTPAGEMQAGQITVPQPPAAAETGPGTAQAPAATEAPSAPDAAPEAAAEAAPRATVSGEAPPEAPPVAVPAPEAEPDLGRPEPPTDQGGTDQAGADQAGAEQAAVHTTADGAGQTPPAEVPLADATEADHAETAGAGQGEAESASEPTQLAAATVSPGVIPAWRRFARPFPPDETRPRIAVVVAGLGLSEAATTAAIQRLPAEITLSFSPYSNRLDEWVAMARAAGHEVMIDLPMEPASFPRDDPGPQALLTSLDVQTNLARLDWTLRRTEGYVGVATYMGSRFTTDAEKLSPVVAELAKRGLLMLDSRAAADSLAAKLAAEAGAAHAINDRFIDNEASRVAIDGRLQQVERIARTAGVAVAMGYAYPVTIERLTEWARGLAGKGLVLAPISAAADQQALR